MCLYIKMTREQVVKTFMKVADKDIPVIKLVYLARRDGKVYSPFQNVVITPGGTQTARKFVICNNAVHNGIHCYKQTALSLLRRGYRYRGLYRYIRATIPKGTPYFEGNAGNLVTLKLCLGKRLYTLARPIKRAKTSRF